MTKNLVTLLRDPAAPSGAIDLVDIDAKLPRAKTGSQYFSGKIDGKFYVLDGHMNKALQTAFDSEQEAQDAAAKKNTGSAQIDAPLQVNS
jgi:hypothetical protein